MADPLSSHQAERQARRRALLQKVSDKQLWEGMDRPWLSVALLLVLVGVHISLAVVMMRRGEADGVAALLGSRPDTLLIEAGGQHNASIAQGQRWRHVTAVFLHGDGLHLALNGAALVGLGRICEAIYGRNRLLFLFLLCGISGSVLSYLGGHRLSVGASGAIFGLLGAPIVFGFRYRHALPEDVGERLRRHLPPWVVVNLVIGLVVPFIDNLAHVGGLVAGGLAAMVLGNRVVAGEEGGRAQGAALVILCLVVLTWAASQLIGSWA